VQYQKFNVYHWEILSTSCLAENSEKTEGLPAVGAYVQPQLIEDIAKYIKRFSYAATTICLSCGFWSDLVSQNAS